MIQEKDRIIIGEFAKRVRRRCPNARIRAFGSRVRGDATWESDFDVCVILDNPMTGTEAIIQQFAWEVGFEHGCVFNWLLFSQEELEKGPLSESALIRNILCEGVTT